MSRPGAFTKNDPRRMVGPRPGAGRKPSEATKLKEKLGDYAEDALKAFKFCSELMNDTSAEKNVRLAAAREVMDRLWGKAQQSIEHSGEVNGRICIIRAES